MKTKTDKDYQYEAYKKFEADANLFNLRGLAVLSIISVLTIVLNEVGMFRVERRLMITGAAAAFVAFFLPILIYMGNRLMKASPIIERSWFRRLIIISAFIGTTVIGISLSAHAVLLLAVPPLIAAQYRERRSAFWLVLAATIVMVPVCVYGSFFFGTTDRNFLKGMLTDEEALVFANRLALATPKRMLELFTHYTLPRLLSIIAIDALVYGMIRRNHRMFDEQLALSNKVREEMETRHNIQNHVIEALANLIETRDAGTGEHIIRTKQYVGMLAAAMREDERFKDELNDGTIELMKNAAPLHDVGKISIPDSILLKPGKLTKEEFEVMKTHAPIGGEIIENVFAGMNDAEFLKMAEDIASAHHERWDGTGYPDGLKGEDIPLAARIMAVADVFDALVSVRVYKGAISPQDALDIIYSESGTHFDPDIIRVVRTISDELIKAAMVK